MRCLRFPEGSCVNRRNLLLCLEIAWRFFQSSETKPGTGSVQDICQAQKPFVFPSLAINLAQNHIRILLT